MLLAEPTFVAAYTVFGMVGFGATLVAAPVLAHVLPVSTLIPAQSLLDLAAASTNGLKLNAHLDKPEFKRLLPPIVIGCALGAYLLLSVPVKTLMLLLGIFVTGYAINGLRPQPARPPISARWAWWYGLTGGVLSAMFGAGGWVYSIYLSRRIDDIQAIRATQVSVLTATSFIRVSLFAIAGRYFDTGLLLLSLCLAPAMMLGLYIGHHITLGMDKKRFMQVLYAVLLLTGASLVARTVAG